MIGSRLSLVGRRDPLLADPMACAHCARRRADHQNTSAACLVAGCDRLGYIDPETPARPTFTLYACFVAPGDAVRWGPGVGAARRVGVASELKDLAQALAQRRPPRKEHP
jgi:hypothetical protein